MKVYVFGNGSISFDTFTMFYKDALESLANRGAHFLIGDCCGADTLAMEYLKDKTPNVTIYHMYKNPRYIPDIWKSHTHKWRKAGGFTFDGCRDRAMIEECSHFLAIDQNTTSDRVSDTMKNIRRCDSLGKIPISRTGKEVFGKYRYNIAWSEEDKEYVGTCEQFPSLSWLSPTKDEALEGIVRIVGDCIRDAECENITSW